MSAVLAALAVALQSTGHMLTIVCVGGIAAPKRVVAPGARATVPGLALLGRARSQA